MHSTVTAIGRWWTTTNPLPTQPRGMKYKQSHHFTFRAHGAGGCARPHSSHPEVVAGRQSRGRPLDPELRYHCLRKPRDADEGDEGDEETRRKRKIGCSKKKDGESDEAWAKRVDLENQAKVAKADLKAMKTQRQKEKVAREDKKVIKSAMKVSPATTLPGSLEMAKKIWPKITVIYVFDCATVGSVDII